MNSINKVKINLDTEIDYFLQTGYHDNPEWVRVIVDSEDKILCGIKSDGTFSVPRGIEGLDEKLQMTIEEIQELVGGLDAFSIVDNSEFISIETDSEGRILSGRNVDGIKFENLPVNVMGIEMSVVDNSEWLQVTTDKDGKILEGIKEDGSKYIADFSLPELDTIDEKLDFLNISYINSIDSIVEQFCSLFKNSTSEFESFIFFTDPHLGRPHYQDMNYQKFYKYMSVLKKYYTLTPTDFVLCGGDLIEEDVHDVAMFKLGFIDGYMRNNFNNYYPIFGNHDDNYQGKIDESSEQSTGQLSNTCIKNLMFRNFDKKYYTFKQGVTRFYILDTGCDWNSSMSGNWVEGNYRWDQIAWRGNSLLENTDEHLALGLHIYKAAESVPQLTHNAIQMLIAFNHKESITFDNITYDFSSVDGTCHFIIAGHQHTDRIYYDYEIPAILTTTMYDSCDFDLCFVDYNTKQFHAIRVPSGRHRIMNIV